MKKKKFKGQGVSMPDEMWENAERRIAKLDPWVDSFSAYVRRLVALDLERGLLDSDGGINNQVVGKGKRPDFNLTPSANFQAIPQLA